MISGWLCFAEGWLAVFDHRHGAECDHLFRLGPIGDLLLTIPACRGDLST